MNFVYVGIVHKPKVVNTRIISIRDQGYGEKRAIVQHVQHSCKTIVFWDVPFSNSLILKKFCSNSSTAEWGEDNFTVINNNVLYDAKMGFNDYCITH